VTTQEKVFCHQDDTSGLATTRSGDGPPILFLHGLFHSTAIWQQVVPLLVDKYSTILIDLPGFGKSEPLIPNEVTIINYSRILHNVINTINARNPLHGIVADSLSTVLLAHASAITPFFPPTRFVLSGCPFDGLPLLLKASPLSFIMPPMIRLLHQFPTTLRRKIIRVLSRYVVYDMASLHDEIACGVEDTDPRTAALIFSALKQPLPSALVSQLTRHKCLFLRGTHDRIIGAKGLRKWATIAGAEYVDLPGCGHTPMIERPAAYANAVRQRMDS
jgi:pimeloyl-ACP methyl ester carboxylesterase